jgi:hypothetical protein
MGARESANRLASILARWWIAIAVESKRYSILAKNVVRMKRRLASDSSARGGQVG